MAYRLAETLNIARRVGHLLLAATLLVTSVPVAHAADEPFISYPMPPASVKEANDTLALRRKAIVEFLACADEFRFNKALFEAGPIETGEGMGGLLAAKMMWLRQFNGDAEAIARARCTNTIVLRQDDVAEEFRRDNGRLINSRLSELTGVACRSIVDSARPLGDQIVMTYTVSGRCMKAQINLMVKMLKQFHPVGTNGLPCVAGLAAVAAGEPPKLTVEGDGDVGIRDMTRIFFLDRGQNILDPDSKAYIRDKLLTLHGKPGPDSYSILDCGNGERSSGTPQELLDEHDFLDETLDDIADAGGWLAKRAALLALLLLPAAALAQGLLGLVGTGAAAGIASALAPTLVPLAGAIALGDITIPETENHRLMIETSRFLKNQIIIDEQKQHRNIGELIDEQKELKAWLLAYMGAIMRRDFAEYNARPYQRYSMVALLNLADFADDPQVKLAARSVMEYSLAKFAIGSREGIRSVPFRRRVDKINANPNMVEFGGEGADYAVALMQFYAGLTQRLPTFKRDIPHDPDSHVTFRAEKGLPYGNPGLMIYAATSDFKPSDAILDLAIDKSITYFQRVHHDGVEIYANAPGFTLSAGGITAPPARSLLIGPVETGAVPFADDHGGPGSGVPTSLIPSGTPHVNRLRLMGFEGLIENVGDDQADGFGSEGRKYDGNACVWAGFACGINYQGAEVVKNAEGKDVDISACFVPGLDNAPAEWMFLNSRNCTALTPAPLTGSQKSFFVARFLMPCTGDDGCKTGRAFGFFEAVDASGPVGDSQASFDGFRRKVVSSNTRVFPAGTDAADAITAIGRYRMFAGANQTITFKIGGGGAGIKKIFGGLRVKDVDDWPFLEGDVLNSQGDGIVTFKNPRTNQFITWNFSNAQDPRRAAQE